MQDQAKLNQAHAQAQAEAAANAGDKLHDLEPPAAVAGLTVRPMTLGILRLCESIGLSLDSGEPSTADLAILALCVCGPISNQGLVALAKQGRPAVQEAADLFAMDLTMADMASITATLNASAPPPAGGGDGPTAKS